MPYMKISGLGTVEVTRLPKRIPKTMRDPMLGGRVKVDREAYKVIWARKYGTARARKKIMRVI
jgi:hypothetical protein